MGLVQVRYYLWEDSKHDTGMDASPGKIVTARQMIRDAYTEKEGESGIYDVGNDVIVILPPLDNEYCSKESQRIALEEGASPGFIVTGRHKKDLAALTKSVGLKFNPKMVVPSILPWEEATSTSPQSR